jgi:hypothetical protein
MRTRGKDNALVMQKEHIGNRTNEILQQPSIQGFIFLTVITNALLNK